MGPRARVATPHWQQATRTMRWLLLLGIVTSCVIVGLAAAQTADLSISPNPAHPEEPVLLDGRDSSGGGETIVGCEFDVDGDGQYERQADDCVIEHTYSSIGEYEITLRITTAGNQRDTATEQLSVVANEPPEPAIAVEPAAPRPDEPVTISAADATDPDGRIVGYNWRLPAGNTSGETIETRFPNPGEYAVALTVIDDDGATATSETTIEVAPNEPPVATLTASPASIMVGERLLLDASGSTDREEAIAEYRWDLNGDGSAEARTETDRIEYEPGAPGEYDPAVVVIDDRGATDRATASYSVLARGTPTPTLAPVDPSSPQQSTPSGAGVSVMPVALAILLILIVFAAVVGVGIRRREIADEAAETLRTLLMRGDIRRRLARTLSRSVIKSAAKRAIRQFSDAIEVGGEMLGGALERAGRAIKRGSSRLAAWLRRFGS
ncbi:MAG: PKD domain-containing protein [Salinirussus sp.]